MMTLIMVMSFDVDEPKLKLSPSSVGSPVVVTALGFGTGSCLICGLVGRWHDFR